MRKRKLFTPAYIIPREGSLFHTRVKIALFLKSARLLEITVLLYGSTQQQEAQNSLSKKIQNLSDHRTKFLSEEENAFIPKPKQRTTKDSLYSTMEALSDFLAYTSALLKVKVFDAAVDLVASIQEKHRSSFQSNPKRRRQPPTLYQIRVLLQLWKDNIVEGDPASVAGRYANNAVLIPFDSEDPLVGQKAILDYYWKFLNKHKPAMVKVLHGTITLPQRKGDCYYVAQDNGIYDIVTDAGELLRMRYNVVYVKENSGRWRIVHHNSARVNKIPPKLLALPFLEDEQLRGYTEEAKERDQSIRSERSVAESFHDETLSTTSETPSTLRQRSENEVDHIVGLLTGTKEVKQEDLILLSSSDHSDKKMN